MITTAAEFTATFITADGVETPATYRRKDSAFIGAKRWLAKHPGATATVHCPGEGIVTFRYTEDGLQVTEVPEPSGADVLADVFAGLPQVEDDEPMPSAEEVTAADAEALAEETPAPAEAPAAQVAADPIADLVSLLSGMDFSVTPGGAIRIAALEGEALEAVRAAAKPTRAPRAPRELKTGERKSPAFTKVKPFAITVEVDGAQVTAQAEHHSEDLLSLQVSVEGQVLGVMTWDNEPYAWILTGANGVPERLVKGNASKERAVRRLLALYAEAQA